MSTLKYSQMEREIYKINGINLFQESSDLELAIDSLRKELKIQTVSAQPKFDEIVMLLKIATQSGVDLQENPLLEEIVTALKNNEISTDDVEKEGWVLGFAELFSHLPLSSVEEIYQLLEKKDNSVGRWMRDYQWRGVFGALGMLGNMTGIYSPSSSQDIFGNGIACAGSWSEIQRAYLGKVMEKGKPDQLTRIYDKIAWNDLKETSSHDITIKMAERLHSRPDIGSEGMVEWLDTHETIKTLVERYKHQPKSFEMK